MGQFGPAGLTVVLGSLSGKEAPAERNKWHVCGGVRAGVVWLLEEWSC